jgi:thioredoxin 1
MRLLLFCAKWCGSCREFRAHFDALDVKGLSKIWLDIEDHAALLEDIEINNLPTILAVSQDGLSFYFGEIPPKAMADDLHQLLYVTWHLENGTFFSNK